MKRILDWVAICIVVILVASCLVGLSALVVLLVHDLIVNPPAKQDLHVAAAAGVVCIVFWALGRVSSMERDA